MKIEPSARLAHFQTGIFAALNEKKEELLASGRKVYNLSVGTPDFPVAEHVRQAIKCISFPTRFVLVIIPVL